MPADHRREFKAKIEAAIKREEARLMRLRHLLDITQGRLDREPNDYTLQEQVGILEATLAISMERLVTLRDTLDQLTGQPPNEALGKC